MAGESSNYPKVTRPSLFNQLLASGWSGVGRRSFDAAVEAKNCQSPCNETLSVNPEDLVLIPLNGGYLRTSTGWTRVVGDRCPFKFLADGKNGKNGKKPQNFLATQYCLYNSKTNSPIYLKKGIKIKVGSDTYIANVEEIKIPKQSLTFLPSSASSKQLFWTWTKDNSSNSRTKRQESSSSISDPKEDF